MDLDRKLLTIFLLEDSRFGQSLGEIDENYFSEPFNKVYKILKSYYKKHNKLPSFDFFEETLFKNKTKLFADLNKPEDFIASFRTESPFVEVKDCEFLIENLKKRKGKAIVEETLPEIATALRNDDTAKLSELFVKTGASIQSTTSTQTVKHSSNHDYLDKQIDRYYNVKNNPQKAWGLKTGFTKLDENTFGIMPGEIFAIAARPGCGKSVWLLSAGLNIFRQGYNVAYFSLEMPEEQIWDRTLASYASLPINKIKEGLLNEEEEGRLQQAAEHFKNSKNRFEVIDSPYITVPSIALEVEKIINEYKPDLVIVDYLGIVKHTDSKLKDNEAQAAIIEDLKILARTKKVPILTAVQLNRDKTKTKGTERLARSDVIAHTLDLAMQIEEFNVEDEMSKLSDKIKITVTKNRKGPWPFTFEVRKNFAMAQFLDWDPAAWGSLIDDV